MPTTVDDMGCDGTLLWKICLKPQTELCQINLTISLSLSLGSCRSVGFALVYSIKIIFKKEMKTDHLVAAWPQTQDWISMEAKKQNKKPIQNKKPKII